MATHQLRIVAERQEDAKALPLTWAQANMWETILASGDQARRLNMRVPQVLPKPYLTTEQVLAGLHSFVAAAEIARTTFAPETASQIVSPSIDIPVQVLDDSGDFASATAALLGEMARPVFRLAQEPPIRFGLVVSKDEVRSLAMVLDHLAFDGASRQFVAALVSGYLKGVPEQPGQPADLVGYEASDRMRERSDATLRHWSQTLAALPAGRGLRFTAPGDFTEWELCSRAIAIAAQRIAVRASVSTTTVVLAALTTVIEQIVTDPPRAMLNVCSNRHYSDLADFAGIALQNALYVIPRRESASGFDSYLASAHMAAIRGYRKARYDSDRWRAMLAGMNAAGAAPDLTFYFNDARAGSTAWDGLEHEIDELRSWKAGERDVAVIDRMGLFDATLFFNLRARGSSARITMVCDNALVAPARAVEVLRRLEDLLVKEALK
jgi:Condensation domain